MTNKIGTSRYGLLAAVTVGMIAVSVGLCGTAQAATGNFTYSGSDGISRTFINPPDGRCIALLTQSRQATTNNTDKVAHLFSTASCATQVAAVAPNASTNAPALAVVFG